MKKALLLFLFTAGSTPALDIPPAHRVANKPPGFCMWASLETLGRCHGIKPLDGLRDKRGSDPDWVEWQNGRLVVYKNNVGRVSSVREKLDSLKVKHQWQLDNNKDTGILKKYADSHGVVIGVGAGAFGKEPHAIVLTHYDEAADEIHFYNCNDTTGLYKATVGWLNHWWLGMAIVVEKD